MIQNVRLQNLRDFTVQIRDANNQIVGTGIAVSTDGKIVTCAHVVQAAGVDPRNSNGAEVGIYFPQARGGEEKNRRATIAKYFEDYDDDIVLLQLTGGLSPLAPEQIPVLGTANASDENPFRSYGYRRLEKYIAGWVHGKIQGSVEAPEGFQVQCEPVQLESSQINSGMSGSAVLDMTRNLVVGIVSETWFPDVSTKDRDTAWAVDGRVLSLEPLGLPLQDISLPLKAAPEPKTDEQTKREVVEVAQVTVKQRTVEEKFAWHNAPAVITEWTGRDNLLKHLTEDWNDRTKHVTGLIGFGGEGKSSLARKWVDSLLNDPSQKQPDGVFWWGFYENRSVDEFLEAALNYMSGGRIDPHAVPSSNLRAQIIGAMLGTGRYLFVLDGLEVMQHQDSDQYGLLQSNDLRALLTFFARPDNQSFCLITSRAPLLDLMEYTTYTHRDVERHSEEDGRALLRRLGVQGSDSELNKVVADWDGHALTLSILAAYLAERYEGDMKHLTDIPVPTANEPRYERVHRVLRRYDEHLSENEREFLKLFSVFRLPVQESAFEKVFEPLLKSLDKDALLKLVSRLVSYRLIRHDEYEKSYTTHPLIRNHYFALFTKGDPSQEKAAHEQIKDYYLSIAGDTPQYPTLDDLKPLIEVIHHACRAGASDEAYQIYEDRIRQGDRSVDVHVLGAYETSLSIVSEFFLGGDTGQEPAVSKQSSKRWILNAIGFRLMALGRLRDAVLFYERAVVSAAETQDWRNGSIGYHNLADLHAHLGALEASAEAARQAFDLARRAEDKRQEQTSVAYQAWNAYLQGSITEADKFFAQSENLEQEVSISDRRFLWGPDGIWHTDYLRRTDRIAVARSIADENLDYCQRNHWTFLVSGCHRVLGDLDSDIGDHASAHRHYESALKIARGISARDVLIEALLARGKWQAKHMKDANATFSDLNEALDYCVESEYRIYEADVRVALGWAFLANGEQEKAKQSAERALQMSSEMGYYWGKVDAEEVLSVIASDG
jgi:tetratricopeptide (TPR) repeat protein